MSHEFKNGLWHVELEGGRHEKFKTWYEAKAYIKEASTLPEPEPEPEPPVEVVQPSEDFFHVDGY